MHFIDKNSPDASKGLSMAKKIRVNRVSKNTTLFFDQATNAIFTISSWTDRPEQTV